jgi:hypothetical protein
MPGRPSIQPSEGAIGNPMRPAAQHHSRYRHTAHRAAISVLVSLSLLGVASPARAQMVAGTTLDANTRAPIPDVQVALVDTAGTVRKTVVSDDAGQFTLVVADSGRYTLRGTRLGYVVARSESIQLGRGETLQVELHMSVQPVPLDPLRVVARERSLRQRDLNEYYRRAEANKTKHLGWIFTRQDLEVYDAWKYETFIRREAPVAFKRCRPAMYWDGRPIQADEMDGLMSISNIEGIEFYRDFGPPGTRFTDVGGCGLVLIWTRPMNNGHPFELKTLFAAVAGFAVVGWILKLTMPH